MSSHLRDDKECQNCGYTVEMAYCPKCGQKNTETRQPFHHLFTHFIEDLTHYDGAFWKTIKHLLFRPGRLTKEYLEGKRQTYVPPVKLYIFISFVTFFLLSLLPKGDENVTDYNTNKVSTEKTDSQTSGDIIEDEIIYKTDNKTFHSLQELIEFQATASESDKLPLINYWTAKAILNVMEKDVSNVEIAQILIKALSKVLFIYMPFFAFWLWLFHGKKRWYFFDHGIFTLHYFSLLLLLIIFLVIIRVILNFVMSNIAGEISFYVGVILYIYAVFYFFRSHRRMYGEKRWISRTKSFMLFWINLVFIVLFVTGGFVYALLNVH
jgi:hypothetical protein